MLIKLRHHFYKGVRYGQRRRRFWNSWLTKEKILGSSCSTAVEHTPREQKLVRSWVQIPQVAGLFILLLLSFPFSPHYKSVKCPKSGPSRGVSLLIMRRTKRSISSCAAWDETTLIQAQKGNLKREILTKQKESLYGCWAALPNPSILGCWGKERFISMASKLPLSFDGLVRKTLSRCNTWLFTRQSRADEFVILVFQ